MAENVSEVLTGAGVIAVAIGFALYAGLGEGATARKGTYELHASFRSADGVSVGTDVRLAGVKVGTVTRLDLNPDTYYADATFSMKDGIVIPDDSTALISSEGLLGGNFLEIQPGGSPVAVEPGGEVLDTQGAVGLIQLLMKFVGKASDSAPATGGTSE
ncbi:MAG: outer membrane lipid asymmetry maintenance protein MlaD [Paracoccaceae bacterium]|jgi:phospholipid/cholesterol/gamma-HCH transport system substrate-binding protein